MPVSASMTFRAGQNVTGTGIQQRTTRQYSGDALSYPSQEALVAWPGQVGTIVIDGGVASPACAVIVNHVPPNDTLAAQLANAAADDVARIGRRATVLTLPGGCRVGEYKTPGTFKFIAGSGYLLVQASGPPAGPGLTWEIAVDISEG